MGLYGEAPPERGIVFRLQVYERVGILLVEVYERVIKYVISVCKKVQKSYSKNPHTRTPIFGVQAD